VQVARAATGPIAATLELTGTVEPREQAKVGPRASGRVAAALVDEGDAVRPGEVLFRLEREEAEIALRQATAALAASRAALALAERGARPGEITQGEERVAQAGAELELAESELRRTRGLVEAGALSPRALDEAEARAKAARAQAGIAAEGLAMLRQGAREEELELARARVGEAEAGVAAAREALARTEIASPLAGVVLARLSSPGEVVTMMPPTVMAVVADLSAVKVAVAAPETRLAELRPGLEAAVAADGVPGRTFAGRVALVPPLVDAASRTAAVEVRVPNPDGLLRAGMFARVSVVTARREAALLVPAAALVDGTVTVAEGAVARRRSVRTGIRTGAAVEILEGLAAGELVVVSGAYGLADGAAISYEAQ